MKKAGVVLCFLFFALSLSSCHKEYAEAIKYVVTKTTDAVVDNINNQNSNSNNN